VTGIISRDSKFGIARSYGLEDFFEIELESGQDRIAAENAWLIDAFRRLAGPIDESGVLDRIEEPAEPRTVSDIFVHLLFYISHAMRWRAKFDDKIGTDFSETLLLPLR